MPVIIAGGPKFDNELDVLNFVYDGMQRGAIGMNLGRNVWQNEHPVAMARAMKAIIHQGATAQQAHQLFLDVKNGKA